MESYFAMSPEQLANLPVTIATGTPKPFYQSAAITSVITAEQIQAMGATELHQVLETVPGLHVIYQPVSHDYAYSLRGIRNSNNSQVLLLMNGSRYSVPYKGNTMTGMVLPVDAIARIEVIRGPGSALYGADAFAGIINIITKKTDAITGTVIAGRAGAFDTQSIWGQHGGHYAGWDVAGMLQYSHTNGDNDRIIRFDAQSAVDQLLGTQASLAPNAMKTNAETWNAHLNLQRKHWDIGFWAFNESDAGMRIGGNSVLDREGIANGENYLADMKFSTEDKIENWELQAHASYLYTHFKADVHVFPDNALLPIGADGNVALPYPAPLVLFPEGLLGIISLEHHLPTLQLNAIYRGFNAHTLRMSGGFRYEALRSSEQKNFGPGVIDGSVPVIDDRLTDVTDTAFVFMPNTHRDIWSAALQDEWQLAENWQLVTGVRYDVYSDFGSTTNPRASLIWDIDPTLTGKLLYGRAFRAPSFSEQRHQNNPILLGNPNLNPETLDSIELAFDYHPFNNLRSAVNFYYYHIEDLIEQVPDAGATSQTAQNNGNQSGYGTELEWDWSITEQLNFKGNYAWQNARSDATQLRVQGVPEHQLYLALNWHFLPHWQLQPQYRFIGRRTVAPGDHRLLADYQSVDLTLRSQKLFKHFDIAASVRNIFNEYGREPATSTLTDTIPNSGRSFYVQIETRF